MGWTESEWNRCALESFMDQDIIFLARRRTQDMQSRCVLWMDVRMRIHKDRIRQPLVHLNEELIVRIPAFRRIDSSFTTYYLAMITRFWQHHHASYMYADHIAADQHVAQPAAMMSGVWRTCQAHDELLERAAWLWWRRRFTVGLIKSISYCAMKLSIIQYWATWLTTRRQKQHHVILSLVIGQWTGMRQVSLRP